MLTFVDISEREIIRNRDGWHCLDRSTVEAGLEPLAHSFRPPEQLADGSAYRVWFEIPNSPVGVLLP